MISQFYLYFTRKQMQQSTKACKKHVTLQDRVSKSGEPMTRKKEFRYQNTSNSDSKFWWNEWLNDWTGRRTESTVEDSEKVTRNQKPKNVSFGNHLLNTTPQHSLSRFTKGYQPISKRRKWTKEARGNPLVKRSPSWFFVSILTRVIRREGSDTFSRNQWYLIA